MAKEKDMISTEEAQRQVKSMIARAALIHYAFSKMIVEELGEKRGKEVIKKAVALYGAKVGEKARQRAKEKGLPNTAENFQDDLPGLGWHAREMVVVDGERRARVHTCYLAETWKELDAADIGRLYCYVDQAKYEAFNPDLECVHTKNCLEGHPYCELAVRKKKK